MTLKLVIFDVDGTLVDSQAHILAAMKGAFEAADLPLPPRDEILAGIGLSLPVLMAHLVPDASRDQVDALVDGYRQSFVTLRAQGHEGQVPLYPGAAEMLATLATQDELLLGIATGKSRRGVAHLVKQHGWQGLFQTVQTADDHPSKPAPDMILSALSETGVAVEDAVILGDTSFDIEMGRAAGITALGVNWGYHSADRLHVAGAAHVLSSFGELPGVLTKLWGSR